MKIHITKQGESLETIAGHYGVSKQDLTGINPHINLASDLVPGLKLKLPDSHREKASEQIEKFYPGLDGATLHESAIPIPLKQEEVPPVHPVFGNHSPQPEPLSHGHHVPHTYETAHPWHHLHEHMTPLSHDPHGAVHHPWQQHPSFSPYDSRALIPAPIYYPSYGSAPYPYPPYSYPGYGYGYGTPLPIPLPIPVPGFGYPGGYHGHGGGFHGGHHHGHR